MPKTWQVDCDIKVRIYSSRYFQTSFPGPLFFLLPGLSSRGLGTEERPGNEFGVFTRTSQFPCGIKLYNKKFKTIFSLSLSLYFSLRAIYGTDSTKNALHGSDSYSSAEREIHFFFPDSKCCIKTLVFKGEYFSHM